MQAISLLLWAINADQLPSSFGSRFHSGMDVKRQGSEVNVECTDYNAWMVGILVVQTDEVFAVEGYKYSALGTSKLPARPHLP